MVDYIIEFFLGLILIRKVFQLKKFFLNHLEISSNKQVYHDLAYSNNKIILVIPIYNENKVSIENCVIFFSQITSNYINIYFVTTEKEGRGKESSYQILQDSLKILGNNRMMVIHSPNTTGYKGEQINFCFSELNVIDLRTVIGIYDVDSKPDLSVLNYLLAQDHFQEVYQQYSLYDGNIKLLKSFLRIGAVYQTFWSICFEMNQALTLKKNGNLKYFIGHGLYIRSDVFYNTNGFPKNAITEDLMYGYKLSLQGYQITPLYQYEHSDYVTNFVRNMKQSANWFAGELQIINFYKEFRSQNKQEIAKVAIRLFYVSLWPVEPLFVLTALFYSIFNPIIMVIVSTLLIITGITGLIVNEKFKSVFAKRNESITVFFQFIEWYLLTFIGPIYYLRLKLSTGFYKPYKTEK